MSALSSYIENLPRSVRLARLATVRKILGGFSAGEMIAAPVRRKHRAPGAVTVGMPGTGNRAPDTPRAIEAARKVTAVMDARAAGLNRRQIIASTGVSKSQVDRIIAAHRPPADRG